MLGVRWATSYLHANSSHSWGSPQQMGDQQLYNRAKTAQSFLIVGRHSEREVPAATVIHTTHKLGHRWGCSSVKWSEIGNVNAVTCVQIRMWRSEHVAESALSDSGGSVSSSLGAAWTTSKSVTD